MRKLYTISIMLFLASGLEKTLLSNFRPRRFVGFAFGPGGLICRKYLAVLVFDGEDFEALGFDEEADSSGSWVGNGAPLTFRVLWYIDSA